MIQQNDRYHLDGLAVFSNYLDKERDSVILSISIQLLHNYKELDRLVDAFSGHRIPCSACSESHHHHEK